MEKHAQLPHNQDLFLIYINDLLCATNNPICSFADNSTLIPSFSPNRPLSVQESNNKNATNSIHEKRQDGIERADYMTSYIPVNLEPDSVIEMCGRKFLDEIEQLTQLTKIMHRV